MSITTLHEALSPSDREILAADRKRWKRLGAGAHLDDWMAFGPGLLLRRQMAMKIAKTNEPQGRQYTAAFSALMVRDGLYDATTKTEPTKGTFSAVLWLNAEPHRLEILHEILRDLTPGQRARLNSPITAGQRVKAVAIERGLEQPPKQRPAKPSKPIDDAVAVLSDRVTDLEGENAHLLEQLAAADSTPHRDGAVDFEQARHTYVTSMTNWSDKAKAEAALQLVRDLKISMMDVQKLWRATTPSMTISLSDSKRRTKKADAPAPSLQEHIAKQSADATAKRESKKPLPPPSWSPRPPQPEADLELPEHIDSSEIESVPAARALSPPPPAPESASEAALDVVWHLERFGERGKYRMGA